MAKSITWVEIKRIAEIGNAKIQNIILQINQHGAGLKKNRNWSLKCSATEAASKVVKSPSEVLKNPKKLSWYSKWGDVGRYPKAAL